MIHRMFGRCCELEEFADCWSSDCPNAMDHGTSVIPMTSRHAAFARDRHHRRRHSDVDVDVETARGFHGKRISQSDFNGIVRQFHKQDDPVRRHPPGDTTDGEL